MDCAIVVINQCKHSRPPGHKDGFGVGLADGSCIVPALGWNVVDVEGVLVSLVEGAQKQHLVHETIAMVMQIEGRRSGQEVQGASLETGNI